MDIHEFKEYIEENKWLIDAHKLSVETIIDNGKLCTQYFLTDSNRYLLSESVPRAFIKYIIHHVAGKVKSNGITKHRVGFTEIIPLYLEFYEVECRKNKLKLLIK